jgi:hypothetical protein
MSYAVVALLVLLYNFALVAGTVYLIVFYDWSPWWFLLTILLLVNAERKK